MDQSLFNIRLKNADWSDGGDTSTLCISPLTSPRLLKQGIASVPQEVLLKVLAWLDDPKDIAHARLACRLFDDLAQENALWSKLASRKWGPLLKYSHGSRWTKGLDWKKYYIQKSLLSSPGTALLAIVLAHQYWLTRYLSICSHLMQLR